MDIENLVPFRIGEQYLIRTVTQYSVGRLKSFHRNFLVLSDASWVADTGQFHECLKTGSLEHYQSFVDDVIVNADSIVDATIWRHELPKMGLTE